MTRSLVFDIYEDSNMTPLKWDRLAAKDGMIGVIMRATIGARVDRRFTSHLKAAAAHDLVPAAYHYLYPGDAEGQADLFVRTIGKLPGWLDVELPGITRADVVGFVKHFRQKTPRGTFLGVYSSASKWLALTRNLDAAELFDGQWSALYIDRAWVLADVQSTPPSHWGGMTVDLWQFGPLHLAASRASKNRSFVDGNIFDGGRRELLELYNQRPIRPPLQERPRYIAGHNAALDAVLAALPTIPVTVPDPGGVGEAGAAAAKAAIADAVASLRLGQP